MKRLIVSKQLRIDFVGFLFALPWILGFLAFNLYPLGASFWYGFTNVNPIRAPQWVGLENYRNIVADPLFYISLGNTLFYTLVASVMNLSMAFFLAMMLRRDFKGISFFRSVFFLPSIIPMVAATMIWIWMLDPQYGLVDRVLGFFGLYQPNWLIDARFTKWSLVLIGLWGTGTTMLIFLAGLKDIPDSYYEAAEIDGAGPLTQLLKITLPAMAHVLVYQLILAVINGFQYFTQVYIITTAAGGSTSQASGGPENSILMYPLYLFHNAFVYLKMGKASAMAWILFAIVAALTLVMVRVTRKQVGLGAGRE